MSYILSAIRHSRIVYQGYCSELHLKGVEQSKQFLRVAIFYAQQSGRDQLVYYMLYFFCPCVRHWTPLKLLDRFFVCLSGSLDGLVSQLEPVDPTRKGTQTGILRFTMEIVVYKWLPLITRVDKINASIKSSHLW